ncbi:MAG: MarR family transcriptional regulator [Oscillospiraceae bacterium]|nr:MarR family transcriptional regulator [Oscillospiraceae bacterium]
MNKGLSADRTEREQQFFGSIFMLSNKMQTWVDSFFPDLTFKQLFLLLFINKIGAENLTVKAVADFTGTSRQNVRKMLERLEADGYVLLTRSEKDARAWSVALTDKSFAYFDEHEQESTKIVSKLFADISDSKLDSAMQTVIRLIEFLDSEK